MTDRPSGRPAQRNDWLLLLAFVLFAANQAGAGVVVLVLWYLG